MKEYDVIRFGCGEVLGCRVRAGIRVENRVRTRARVRACTRVGNGVRAKARDTVSIRV